MAQRVGRGIALLFHDRGTRSGQQHAPAALYPRERPCTHFTGRAPRPVWTGGKSRPYRDSIPDRPACSQSLYRLSYPAHCVYIYIYMCVCVCVCLCVYIKPLYFPTDAQIYNSYIQYFKVFKIVPTCFGSQEIHHQGEILNIFKYFITILIVSTNYIFMHPLDIKVF